VNKIDSKWNELSDKSAQNLLRIKDGLRKRKFVASVQDMDFWLNQVESQLQSSDLGRDLTSVQSLLKKNQAIEADIAGHEEPLSELNNTDKNGNNEELLRPLNERYNAAKKACAHRKVQLTDANSLFQVHHFFSFLRCFYLLIYFYA
jgi:spectrin alpha